MTKNLVVFNKILLFIKKYFTGFNKKLLIRKKHLAISVSKVFLNIILFILGMLLVMFISTIPLHGINMNICIWIILCSIYFLIIYDLRKIVYSTKSTPFCFDNVKRFRRIGYYMVFMAILDGIINWKTKSNFILFGSESGSLKGSFVMYIILACIALVLAEIFEKAVEIKDENDLTI
ncbi:DUF2975 domain-containing protein [Clostridium sp.]|uniref:DUF2975 domain-containing protein n=1 Tax=Clostridium sp. TaxID=1506 RepID=UPI00284ED898|nr:DUF2975 domain-containing protein [Clostridium sp.]MDR3595689.1 DUF2975 domain-containing protein [Clostridium sp.]